MDRPVELLGGPDYDLELLDMPIRKYGKELVLTFSMQYKLIKHMQSYEKVKLSKEVTYQRLGPGHYMLYKGDSRHIAITCNEMIKLVNACTYLEDEQNWTALRLKTKLLFLTDSGYRLKKIFVDLTLARIPKNVEYTKEVFLEAYHSISKREYYKKCFCFRPVWMEFYQPYFFDWYVAVCQYEIEMTVNHIMRDNVC